MPIFDDEHGSRIAQFGTGDIAITSAQRDGVEYQDEIALLSDDRENPVNTKISPERWQQDFAGKRSDDPNFNVPIRLQFGKVESIDALIATLRELRAGMPGEETSCDVSFDDFREEQVDDLPCGYERAFYIFGGDDQYEKVSVYVTNGRTEDIPGDDPCITDKNGTQLTLTEVEQAARTWAAIAEMARSVRDNPKAVRALFEGRDLPTAMP